MIKRKDRFNLAMALLGELSVADVRLRRVVDRHVARVLAATDGNLSLAAELLGVNRRSLQRRKQRKPTKRKRTRR